VLTQNQRENTSEIILEKQLLLPVNQGLQGHFQTFGSPSFYSEEDYSREKNNQDSWLSSPGVNVPAKSPQGKTVYCSEKLQKKTKGYISHSTGLNVKVHGSKIRKRLNKYGLFGRESLFSI